jgi:hypothetical protein
MRWSHPSSECGRSAAAAERDGRGSSIALTNTASNNPPKPSSSENIGLLQFSPQGPDIGRWRSCGQSEVKRFTPHTEATPHRRYLRRWEVFWTVVSLVPAQARAAYRDDRWPKQAISGCLPRCADAIHAQVWHGSGPATGCGSARARRYRSWAASGRRGRTGSTSAARDERTARPSPRVPAAPPSGDETWPGSLRWTHRSFAPG